MSISEGVAEVHSLPPPVRTAVSRAVNVPGAPAVNAAALRR